MMKNSDFDLNVTLFVEQSKPVEVVGVQNLEDVKVIAGRAGPKGTSGGVLCRQYPFCGDSEVWIKHNMGKRPISVALFDAEFNPFFAGTRSTENEIGIRLCEFVDGFAVVLFDFS